MKFWTVKFRQLTVVDGVCRTIGVEKGFIPAETYSDACTALANIMDREQLMQYCIGYSQEGFDIAENWTCRECGAEGILKWNNGRYSCHACSTEGVFDDSVWG
jgi:hypothetical protein